MQIPVLIEPVAGNGYSAKALGLCAHADTKEEALHKLKQAVESRPQPEGEVVWLEAKGAEVQVLELLQGRIVALEHEVADLKERQAKPWRQAKGMYANDPLFDEWQAAIAEYRKERDNDPDLP
jgi:hypothetical protein